MGNCQAAEAATVVIQHPAENRVDRFYWSVSALEVMNSNPGHYVALVAPSAKTEYATTPVKQLKLLKPSDTLLLGQVYRLISFEDVLKELYGKKSVKLGTLLKERGRGPEKVLTGLGDASEIGRRKSSGGLKLNVDGSSANTEEVHQLQLQLGRSSSSSRLVSGRQHGGQGQWRPALQSISEIGT
ncbi:unnamed protein product [Linum trigynum]|uniref:DUF4228 domain protein n=1 Tax=Linum trigynum TaxID=586398 RepID=A0AAV2E5G4_9ROSI